MVNVDLCNWSQLRHIWTDKGVGLKTTRVHRGETRKEILDV